MTLIRKLALKVSDTVVRFASPGCKEWAEGLAREVDFVESDWGALLWALSSARVLFDYREAPVDSLYELSRVAQRFAEVTRRGNIAWGILFSHGFIYSDRLSYATNLSERVGCSLVMFGAISMGMISLIQWRNRTKVPPDDDITALIRFYRSRLEYMRDLYRSPKAWITGVAFLAYSVGLMLAERGGVRVHPGRDVAIGLLWVGVALLFLHTRRINRRRLERLEVLLAERS
jgi:hypothetical protein